MRYFSGGKIGQGEKGKEEIIEGVSVLGRGQMGRENALE
jgi:hypothetical protein